MEHPFVVVMLIFALWAAVAVVVYWVCENVVYVLDRHNSAFIALIVAAIPTLIAVALNFGDECGFGVGIFYVAGMIGLANELYG